ncbi:MAG: hypothetical protein LBG68_04970 [Coriobacteriales bacterium]|jgi:uncharacterized protein (DUF697 family)|nr:hypothetical protein [Coriobacteriales bacterium]
MRLGLPVDLGRIRELVSGTEKESLKPLKLELFVDETVSPALRAAARDYFRPESPNLTVLPASYGMAVSTEITDFEVCESADLSVILAGSSPLSAVLMLQVQFKQRPVVIVCEDLAEFIPAWPTELLDIDSSNLIALSPSVLEKDGLPALFANLAKWIITTQAENRLAWARSLGFVRQALSRDIVNHTSMQNGVIATVIFIPGADLPVLLINQLRMFLRLAAIYGLLLNSQRYRELLVIVLTSFGWRGLARRLASSLPAVSWAVKGVVGYSGTLALGKAAEMYLEQLRLGLGDGQASEQLEQQIQHDEA